MSDCIVIEGSNMAECHPVAFRWVTQAKLNGATIIHVDPRFTRTSALADIHAPVRAGSDIAFLGGLVNYVLNSERWRTDTFFQEYLLHYTNAATLVDEQFQDTEDLQGAFSGLMAYTGDPLNGFQAQYDNTTWQYARGSIGDQGRSAATAQSGEQTVTSGTQPAAAPPSPGPPFDALVRSLRKPASLRDETLQDPRTVSQILKRHYSRYTPEMVERVTGCAKDTFLKVAEAILANSGRDRTTSFCYAVGWTQHTYGPQMIGCCALLQLLLGNIGRPGGGVVALRGHATIQGSTDVPTLYHSIHGYMPAPSVLKPHRSLSEYLQNETLATGAWASMPSFLVSYLKSMYGDAATADNQFGYDWHPKITGDHSHLPMMVATMDGRVKGMFAMGQNPAVGGQNAQLQRRALAKLNWLVVKDNFETETAAFWYRSPEVQNGQVKTEDIATEVFFFPSAQVAEMAGSYTNTQRLIQWHHQATDPPGDCRSDIWFTYHLGRRLKQLYADSTLARDLGIKNLVWNYAPDTPPSNTRIVDEPDVYKILREINGYDTASGKHLNSSQQLKDDGSTTCASWIYCGVYPVPDRNLAASREPNPPDQPGAHLNWGFAWPVNRRMLYNRASADLAGKPWSERKKWVWWDGHQWTGFDVPDFPPNKAPDTPAQPEGIGIAAHSGADPFLLKADGKGWLFVPTGLVDGPLPTHYEPAESPVHNPLYPQQSNPVLKYWQREDNLLALVGDARYPYIVTTYRLTEHHLTGVMTRWSPWLAELQPELFVELSPELAQEKDIANLGFVTISTPRGAITAKALVTPRMRPFTIDGRVIHHIGMPWHWGYQGVVTGAVVNDLTALVGDPNVSIHEGKAFVCNVEKA
jgi:formate dehydrogenase major subunit